MALSSKSQLLYFFCFFKVYLPLYIRSYCANLLSLQFDIKVLVKLNRNQNTVISKLTGFRGELRTPGDIPAAAFHQDFIRSW